MEPLFDSKAVEAEYLRWLKHFGEEDRYDGKETVGLLDVLRAHFLIADYFFASGSGMGGIGPRESDLLHSAVYRQFVAFGGKEKWTDPFQKAATLIFGIVNDHPFHDANKRTGLLVCLFALHKMKRVPEVSQRSLEDLMVEIAEGSLKKYPRQKALAKRNEDADVLFVADYLRRNSRALDSKYYCITYQELDARLRNFGFRLSNPHKNFIDVVRVDRTSGILGFGGGKEKLVKVAQVGFPGWKSQVGKGAIATVRRSAGLTPERGVDSATFFQGADALYALIDQYSAPLERLAHR